MTKPTFNNKLNECVTLSDGRKIWLSRSVAVCMFLIVYVKSEMKYYIAIEKRGTKPDLDNKGLWCLPCGYLDWNETAAQAVKRELWEEIGIVMDDLTEFPNDTQPFYVESDPSKSRQNVTLRFKKVISLDALPTLTPNNDCEPNEVADAKWVGLWDLMDDIKNNVKTYEFAFNHAELIKNVHID